METNISYLIFPYNSETHIFELEPTDVFIDDTLKLLQEMFWGGFFDGKAIYIDKFLREDLSINLERLEIASMLASEYLLTVTSFDDPITLYIDGLSEYYEIRGIADKLGNQKEEYYVIKGIVEAIVNEESPKPIKVKYVSDESNAHSRGE